MVMSLQGQPVDPLSAPPTRGKALVYDGSKWVARTATGPVGPTGPQGPAGPRRRDRSASSVRRAQGIQGVAGSDGPAGYPGRHRAHGRNRPTGPEGASPFTLVGDDAVFTGVGRHRREPTQCRRGPRREQHRKGLPRTPDVVDPRAAILIPPAGLLVYQNDIAMGFYDFDGELWNLMSDGGSPRRPSARSPLQSSGGSNPVISLAGTIPVASGGTGAATSGGRSQPRSRPDRKPDVHRDGDRRLLRQLDRNASTATPAGRHDRDTATTAENVTGVAACNGGTGRPRLPPPSPHSEAPPPRAPPSRGTVDAGAADVSAKSLTTTGEVTAGTAQIGTRTAEAWSCTAGRRPPPPSSSTCPRHRSGHPGPFVSFQESDPPATRRHRGGRGQRPRLHRTGAHRAPEPERPEPHRRR